MQSKEIIEILENESSKEFIDSNLMSNLSELALKYAGKTSFNLTVCLQLIAIYKKAKYKLPSLYKVYPALTERAFQQASSESVARFKSKIINGSFLLEICGGLGVDSIAFSHSFDQIVSLDLDEDLNKMAEYNFKKLGIANITRLCRDGENLMEGMEPDWVYIDPDRRPNKKRIIGLRSMQPNVDEIIPKYIKNASIAIKLSPLFEVKQAIKVFEHLTDVYVISEKNEVKEVLVILKPGAGKKKLHAVDLSGEIPSLFSFDIIDMDVVIKSSRFRFDYLYIPYAVLVKAHVANAYAASFQLNKFNDFAVFTGNTELNAPLLRTFKILASSSTKVDALKRYCSENSISGINIVAKGGKLKSADWAKKIAVKEGGVLYLIILQGAINEAYFCDLIS